MLRKNTISIRPFEAIDVPCLKEWFYSGDYPEFFRDMQALTNAQLEAFSYMKDCLGYMVYKEGRPIGFILLYDYVHVSGVIKLSILIDKEFQEQGFALKSMIIIADYIFNKLRANKLVVETLADNKRLQQILVTGGFDVEAILKKESFLDGKHVDIARYYLFEDKYREVVKTLGGENG